MEKEGENLSTLATATFIAVLSFHEKSVRDESTADVVLPTFPKS